MEGHADCEGAVAVAAYWCGEEDVMVVEVWGCGTTVEEAVVGDGGGGIHFVGRDGGGWELLADGFYMRRVGSELSDTVGIRFL